MSEPLIIRCPNCGTSNRVQQEKLTSGRQPVCGTCKTPLALSSKPLHVTDANFSSEVETAALPVLLDLWAPWCGPCRIIAPVIEQLASEMSGRVLVGKLNVDENPAVAGRFRVQSIPTLLVLKSGREVDRMVGAQPKGEIIRRLQNAIALT